MFSLNLSTIFTGISRQLLIWFLLISIIPLSIVSWVSYQSAREQLFDSTRQTLLNVAEVQTLFIQTSFDRITLDLDEVADWQSTSHFLSSLHLAYQANLKNKNHSLKDFTRSYSWQKIVTEYSSDLIGFVNAYRYYDAFLIDPEGNILFTTLGENDVGINLYNGKLSQSKFAQAAQQSYLSGRPVFSDLEFYSPSNNRLSGFFINPVLDKETGDKIGLVAFQITAETLDQLLTKEIKFGKTGKRYLIGADQTLRIGNIASDIHSVLNKKIKTLQTNRWYRQYVEADIHQEAMVDKTMLDETRVGKIKADETISIYPGHDDTEVLGIHSNIDILDVSWGYIAEISVDEAFASSNALARLMIMMVLFNVFVVLILSLSVTRKIVNPIATIALALTKVGKGQFPQLKLQAAHELGQLISGFNHMIWNLQESKQITEENLWIHEGHSQLKDEMLSDQTMTELARNCITFLCHYLDAQIGAFYTVRDKEIKLTGRYALHAGKETQSEMSIGEGLVGQAALEKKMLNLTDIPADYLTISSGLGSCSPQTITIIPLMHDNRVVALLEFGHKAVFSKLQKRLIELVEPTIAISVQSALSREQTKALLIQTQTQAEALQVQEEELRDSNTQLEQQADNLRHSEEILRKNQVELEDRNNQLQAQQEQLRVANEELEDKAGELKTSHDIVEIKNQKLEQIGFELEQRAEELALSSRYKSEFLANMSHELRTPLNSLLILAKLLADNKNGNLTEQQLEFSRTIHDSGSDLLELINDILDLSKIESGKMEVNIEAIHLEDFISSFKSKFQHMADDKGIQFEIQFSDAPAQWRTDGQKLGQIIKNLLSNAFKFTQHGQIILRITSALPDVHFINSNLATETTLAFSVIDSGLGIPLDKQKSIFEAFQQADGTTSRQFGGTGLGLSISRELARLIGGEIKLKSEMGQGSTFTLYIPKELILELPVQTIETPVAPRALSQSSIKTQTYLPVSNELEKNHKQSYQASENQEVTPQEKALTSSVIPDDRHDIQAGDRSLLIIEDDARFALILANTARERGFKVLVAADGEAGLHFADYYQPSGIILDIGLPKMDGWQVMSHLKEQSKTRHIPVHFMSAHDDQSLNAMKNGAIGFLTKPVSMEGMEQAFGRIEHIIDRPVKQLLLVEDDPVQLKSMQALIGNNDVKTITAESGAKAIELLASQDFDCIVLDCGLPDMSGLELLETLRAKVEYKQIPLIIYTGKDLSPKEQAVLDKYAQSIIIKDVRSPERLLDDTTLFLHRVESNLPKERQRTIRMLHDRESIFEQRQVLVVDDDMRNVFALSAALQEKNMIVLVAKNGREALEKLENNPDTAIVLMDIMMPEMDGYEASQKIREQSCFNDLPIIALTAKAMKGDRAKCIAAGASDYLAKPVDIEKLLSMMRVWLYR